MLFPQWTAALAAGKAKKLTYVAGSEARVRQAAVAALASTETFEQSTARCTGDNDAEVWAELNQHPQGEHRRLVVVREAERLRDWSQLTGWTREMRTVTAIFESADAEFTPELGNRKTCRRGHRCPGGAAVKIERLQNGRERRRCAACEDTRQLLVRRGHWVDVSSPRTEHQTSAYAEMLAAYAGTGRSRTERLLRAAHGNVGDCLEALDKLRLMGLELTERTGRAALPARAGTAYETALRAGDRAAAATAAREVEPETARYVVARLTGWLLLLARSHRAVRTGAGTPDLVRLLGTDWITASRVSEEAPRWTPDKVDAAVAALADTALALAGGAREGALEMLASRW